MHYRLLTRTDIEALQLRLAAAGPGELALVDAAASQGLGQLARVIGSSAPISSGVGGANGITSFFEGAQYTEKVVQQMSQGAGEFHSFSESVTAFEGSGTVSEIVGGDNISRQMLGIPGSYLSKGGTWYDGVFQFIKDANGAINHRLFVPTP